MSDNNLNINHLDNHPYAFLNENNIVIDYILFADHNIDLVNQVKDFKNASNAISSCEFGTAYIDGDFYNNKFYPPKPYLSWVRDEDQGIWIAPTPYPTDSEQYIWDENTLSWLLLPPSN